jgi:hypothetical protein
MAVNNVERRSGVDFERRSGSNWETKVMDFEGWNVFSKRGDTEMMSSWDWFFGIACEEWDATGDHEKALERMVDRLAMGIPRAVLEAECRAYISTASCREELASLEAGH